MGLTQSAEDVTEVILVVVVVTVMVLTLIVVECRIVF
jgi:hypothetical protein